MRVVEHAPDLDPADAVDDSSRRWITVSTSQSVSRRSPGWSSAKNITGKCRRRALHDQMPISRPSSGKLRPRALDAVAHLGLGEVHVGVAPLNATPMRTSRRPSSTQMSSMPGSVRNCSSRTRATCSSFSCALAPGLPHEESRPARDPVGHHLHRDALVGDHADHDQGRERHGERDGTAHDHGEEPRRARASAACLMARACRSCSVLARPPRPARTDTARRASTARGSRPASAASSASARRSP